MVWVGRLLSFVEHNDIYNPCHNLQRKMIDLFPQIVIMLSYLIN